MRRSFYENSDFKSFLIGILSASLFFLMVGADDKNLHGDIVVNSIIMMMVMVVS